jgi:hypothetical protein
VTMGIHPLVAFLANMQVQRDGKGPAPDQDSTGIPPHL